LTRCVRVANTRLKVAVFSIVCGRRGRAAAKGLREELFRIESRKLKEPEEGNTETLCARRFRGEDWAAGTGWRLTITNHVTRYANTLSSVYCTAIRIICGKVGTAKVRRRESEKFGEFLNGQTSVSQDAFEYFRMEDFSGMKRNGGALPFCVLVDYVAAALAGD